MTLPTQKQNRDTFPITPQMARVFLAGTPGSGKTTLGASWAPETTLIIDTQNGTTLLDGDHYVTHVSDWQSFTAVVADLVKGDHPFKTVVIDLIDDVWLWCDVAYAGKNGVSASATDDYQKAIKTAETMFRHTLGSLIGSPLGIWFLSHADEKQDGQIVRYATKLDKRVKSYVIGVCQFAFLAETLGTGRKLHTQPTAKFEAKARVPKENPMPSPMELDARALWRAMDERLNPAKYAKKKNAAPVQAEPQEVAA